MSKGDRLLLVAMALMDFHEKISLAAKEEGGDGDSQGT